MNYRLRDVFHSLPLLLYTGILAFFFAQVEIQIEGANGWAAALPTWRVEKHFLLDLFWGGRPLTGYHAWVFSFMLLAFHLPLAFTRTFSWRVEARIVGALMLFWIAEDALWFILNPAYGLTRLSPEYVTWHRHWWGGLPTDYVTFTLIGLGLMGLSYRKRSDNTATGGQAKGAPP